MYKILEDLTYDGKQLPPESVSDLSLLGQAQIDSLIQRGVIAKVEAKAKAEEKPKIEAKVVSGNEKVAPKPVAAKGGK